MPTQKIILHSVFNLFCTCCGEVIVPHIKPLNFPNANTCEFVLTGIRCGNCGNESDFNVTRSEIKRLLIE